MGWCFGRSLCFIWCKAGQNFSKCLRLEFKENNLRINLNFDGGSYLGESQFGQTEKR